MIPAAPALGVSFRRKRVVRIAAGAASAGVLAAMSLVGASAASAATDADCTTGLGGNTATDQASLQNLLNGTDALICVTGTINLATNGLTFARDGITLYGTGSGATLNGGGTLQILADASTSYAITVQNLDFESGSAFTPGSPGGAIEAGYVTAIDSIFNNNSTNQQGGAIYAQFDVDIEGSTFDHNSAAEDGGAVYSDTGTITVNSSTFTDGIAQDGGALYTNDNVDITVTSSSFTNNTATNFGGGAIAGYGNVTVTSSTFTSNSSNEWGGAIYAYAALNVYSSTFDGNSADNSGGALFQFNQKLADIENSTFYNNTSGDSGGAAFLYAGLVLQNTFVISETGGNGGQAVYSRQGADATGNSLQVRGNIFTGDPGQIAAASAGTVTDLGGNIFSSAQADETAFAAAGPQTKFGIPASALFVTSMLGDNGGPTQTIALSDTSPAIDNVPTGTPSVTVDQRGVPRTTYSDSGAYEWGGKLAATGLVVSPWLGGVAALVLAAGIGFLAFGRRMVRSRS